MKADIKSVSTFIIFIYDSKRIFINKVMTKYQIRKNLNL